VRVLLVGGSGHVGTFITPYLRQHHELRVLGGEEHLPEVGIPQGQFFDRCNVSAHFRCLLEQAWPQVTHQEKHN
jgi:nucleoside-diphosphate-sugar epimerase